MTVIFHLFEKPDVTSYGLILGVYLQKTIVPDIFNGPIYSSWYEVQVPMVDMVYWNNTIIGDNHGSWITNLVDPFISIVQGI